MWWAQPKLDLVAHRAVYDKQRRRFCRAIQGGDRKEIRQLENWLLKSHTAKILAVAYAAQKKGYPLYPAKLDMMASMLRIPPHPGADHEGEVSPGLTRASDEAGAGGDLLSEATSKQLYQTS